MHVLLSIKPRYAKQIFSGSKRYEFRKSFLKCGDGGDNDEAGHRITVHMYLSSPVKKIVGYFTTEEVIEDHPQQLWTRFKGSAGIDEEEFFCYFGDKQRGYAIRIDDVKVLSPKDPWVLFPGFVPPQSFCYIDQQALNLLNESQPSEPTISFPD